MQELHGVVAPYPNFVLSMKAQSLLFDSFHLAGTTDFLKSLRVPGHLRAEEAFLRSTGIIKSIPENIMLELLDETLFW